jgi:hypothetical protein
MMAQMVTAMSYHVSCACMLAVGGASFTKYVLTQASGLEWDSVNGVLGGKWRKRWQKTNGDKSFASY